MWIPSRTRSDLAPFAPTLPLTPAQAKLFTSHTSLKPVRRAFNHFPWSGLSLPALRAQFGLESSITWKAAFRWSGLGLGLGLG